MAVRSPQDVYARHVSSSRGYPMWTPEPSSQLLSYRPEGLRIGDVGVVVPENGNFDVFFNICLPKEHQFHQTVGVPDGFNPIELGDADIETVLNVESAGQALTGSSVTRVSGDTVSLPARTGQTGATGYSFNLSSSEGAVLVLPEGADRHDIRDPHPFFEQASRHAATWYHFAEEKLGRIISHDSIYVITGFHKARSWGLAGYQNEQGSSDFSAQFTVGAREGENMAAKYSWETTRNMDWRVGPFDGLGIPNQSVFIRGFKIALRSDMQGVPQRWISYVPNVRSHHGPSHSLLANIWRRISKTLGVSRDGSDHGGRRDAGEDTGVQIEIQRVPEILPVFHPSDVINQHILKKEPSAKVAITHDKDWGFILEKYHLKSEELVQDEFLRKAVDDVYSILVREGVAHLERKRFALAIRPGRDSVDFDVQSDSDASDDSIADGCSATVPPSQAPILESTEAKGENEIVQPHPQSLSVVSESNYRCFDESGPVPIASASCPVDLQSIPSKLKSGANSREDTPTPDYRSVKIIVISDYICGFCYICDKILRDAIDACRDLPVRFDVEFRPFTLMLPSIVPATGPTQVIYRNDYVVKRFGKEPAEIKLKVVREFAQKAGLEFAEDSIICRTTQVHRLSAKAYRDGGQNLQNKFNTYIFDACHTKGADLSDEDVLVDAAVETGFMDKEEATKFLHSTDYLDCVEKMVAAARAQGIRGVPFVIIDGKWAVNGLQPAECFVQIFRKLSHQPPTPDGNDSKTEHGRGAC